MGTSPALVAVRGPVAAVRTGFNAVVCGVAHGASAGDTGSPNRFVVVNPLLGRLAHGQAVLGSAQDNLVLLLVGHSEPGQELVGVAELDALGDEQLSLLQRAVANPARTDFALSVDHSMASIQSMLY